MALVEVDIRFVEEYGILLEGRHESRICNWVGYLGRVKRSEGERDELVRALVILWVNIWDIDGVVIHGETGSTPRIMLVGISF